MNPKRIAADGLPVPVRVTVKLSWLSHGHYSILLSYGLAPALLA